MTLIDRIRHAQVLAAENVVIQSLEQQGLIHPNLSKLERFAAEASALVVRAGLEGLLITIERRALPPLTMAHAETVVDVRLAAGDDRTYGGTLPAAED